jgi:hypothetical protein
MSRINEETIVVALAKGTTAPRILPTDAYMIEVQHAEIIWEDLPLVPNYCKAHGTLMSITFLLVFPLGAILTRLVKPTKRVWIHAPVQLLGVALLISGLAIGIRMADILAEASPLGRLMAAVVAADAPVIT